MRVTKLIREYVEKVVKDALPVTDHPEYAAVSQRREEAIDEYEDCMKNYAADLRQKLNSKYSLPEQWELAEDTYRWGHVGIRGVDYNSDLSMEQRKHQDGIKTRRKEAIESILLELELGATKADLERLIAEAVSK